MTPWLPGAVSLGEEQMNTRYTRVSRSKVDLKTALNDLFDQPETTAVIDTEKGYSFEKAIPDSRTCYEHSFSEVPFSRSDSVDPQTSQDGQLADESQLNLETEIIHGKEQGMSIEELSQTFSCSLRKVRKILAREQYRKIAGLPLDFIPNSEFTDILSRKEERTILGGPWDKSNGNHKGSEIEPLHGSASDLPLYLSRIGKQPLLNAEQEVHLFRKMNYLKFKAAKLRQSLDSEAPKVAVMNRIERLYAQIVAVKNCLIASNLRLVVSIAKKHETEGYPLYDLISDGNISLMRAVDKFDYSRGNKFSTYATWAISRNFSRTIPDEMKYRHRFFSGDTDEFETRIDSRTSHYQDERVYSERIAQIALFMRCLDERERDIIERRYGLGPFDRVQTLRQVGHELGVTKERVRQIESRALNKLRRTAKDEKLELPGPY